MIETVGERVLWSPSGAFYIVQYKDNIELFDKVSIPLHPFEPSPYCFGCLLSLSKWKDTFAFCLMLFFLVCLWWCSLFLVYLLRLFSDGVEFVLFPSHWEWYISSNCDPGSEIETQDLTWELYIYSLYPVFGRMLNILHQVLASQSFSIYLCRLVYPYHTHRGLG